VSRDGSNLVFSPDATTEQRTAAQAVVTAWPLQQARNAAIARVDAGYVAALAAGITPQGSQVTLAAADTDQNAFTRQATLLREAQELGYVNDDTEQTIVDAAGTPHTLTIAHLRGLLVGYGMALKALFDTRATKRAAAAVAPTIEDANAIDW
jgi:hypothetical protein